MAALDASYCDHIVLLPLYPQYSKTTTGSSLNEWNRKFSAAGRQVSCITDFYRNGLYLEALTDRVEEALSRFPDPNDVVLIFSAHSVPVAVIEQGDPYQRQIEETVSLVMRRGGWLNCHRLCYQSKVGTSKWLQPSLRSTIRELGAAGIQDVCVVPISSVSDHVETLGEIDHEGRELAAKAGITRFEMTDGLNDSPAFIAALSQLVMDCVQPVRKEPAFATRALRAVARG